MTPWVRLRLNYIIQIWVLVTYGLGAQVLVYDGAKYECNGGLLDQELLWFQSFSTLNYA